jgi:hypothetical protein
MFPDYYAWVLAQSCGRHSRCTAVCRADHLRRPSAQRDIGNLERALAGWTSTRRSCRRRRHFRAIWKTRTPSAGRTGLADAMREEYRRL